MPARLQPGSWYALPQSPQLFKQLLMVAGMERYYQIARCYRDEDFRADRQPEFTQLDIEMSFVDQDDVIEVGEAIVRALWQGVLDVELGDIPRLTYAERMARYGTDKPDLRFGLELVDLTDYFADTPFRVFQAEHVGRGGHARRRAPSRARRSTRGRSGPSSAGPGAWRTSLFGPDGELGGPVAKNLSDDERAGLAAAVGASPGDCVFFAAGRARRGPGAARRGPPRDRPAGRADRRRRPSAWAFCWVVDAPMFEPTTDDAAGWTAVHHPFTAPDGRLRRLDFEDDPGEALAYAYDIVCNGNEIGGGSIRIHRAEMQQRVFDVLGISPDEAQAKFGFLLEAFQYGPPPHGGIAFGWDRICMLLAGADSIREVIAFPKTGGGYDPLTGAPTPITAQQRAEAGIDFTPPPAQG